MTKPQRDRARDEAHCQACGSPARFVDCVRETRTHRREEITAQGFDDFRQLLVPGTGSDPLGWPGSTGLRVPSFAATTAYRFLLAAADLDDGDMVVGIRQGLEIGAIAASVAEGSGNPVPPMYAEIRPVVTYNWRFADAAWAWTLTRQPLSSWQYTPGPNDSDSFAFEDSLTPALLYASANFPVAPVFPGYLGLSAYTPPAIRGNKVLVARDIRWPFDSPQANEELWIPVHRPERWRLYCDVFQTAGETQTFANGTDVRQITGLVPEEEFLFFINAASGIALGPTVWRVHGRLIVDRMRKGA
ncbi:MAG TPA: hypothetical protein VE987_03825 [Polyangiaceae bacterium]|nr:hypothetical protein [Polyangiaceae bacterium]